MGENEIKIKTGTFNFSGYYNWPGLYKLITGWAKRYQYQVFEPRYKDKTSKSGFTERELKWFFDKKVNRMIRYQINIKLEMLDCQLVDVTQNGKTTKMERGRFKLNIEGNVIDDYQKIFENAPNWIKNTYCKLTGIETGGIHGDFMRNHIYELLAKVKQHLGVST